MAVFSFAMAKKKKKRKIIKYEKSTSVVKRNTFIAVGKLCLQVPGYYYCRDLLLSGLLWYVTKGVALQSFAICFSLCDCVQFLHTP